MVIRLFRQESWLTCLEKKATFNLSETSVLPLCLNEIFEICYGEDHVDLLPSLLSKKLDYGEIIGNEKLRCSISKLYDKVSSDFIVSTHGGTGGNSLALRSLVNDGDEIICFYPTYQQLYSLPESYGAKIRFLKLKPENRYIPDVEELRNIISRKTKGICINNPNNPTGSLIPNSILREICEIASSVGAWVLCDETYRELSFFDRRERQLSVADIYEKGVSVGSVSKSFSAPGLRIGWIATQNDDILMQITLQRDYDHLSCCAPNEIMAACLINSESILKRNVEVLRENLDCVEAFVKKNKHLNWVKPNAGSTALINYDYNVPSIEFCQSLYVDFGVLLVPGDFYGCPKSFRLGFACENDTLKSGLNEMGKFIKSKKWEGVV